MKLLTVKQVSEELQLSQATIGRMCSAGDLPHIVLRAGRRKRVIRFRGEDIEKWLAARTHTGTEARRSRRKSPQNGDALATEKTASEQVSEEQSKNGCTHQLQRLASSQEGE